MKAEIGSEREATVGKEIFERELARIQRIIDFIASRHRLDPLEREDFGSYVTLKLLEDDCRRIRQFRGESRLETYLNVVIQRLFLDFRAERWGKWRPSVRARTLGQPAVLVERLLYRDGLDRNEAREMLAQHGVYIEPDHFEALLQEIPYRPRRQQVGGESLAQVPTASDGGELSECERSITARTVESALRSALCELTSEERVLLKLRFLDGCTVKEIAAALGLPERPLYTRLQRLFGRLRGVLEKQRVHRDQARAVWQERIDIDVESALA
ncbi:MAG TPA: sigma-70 family RNA polymerase sigma factor [Vicinamibacteria bacterium]